MSEREPQKDAPRLVPTSAVLHEAHVGDIHGAFGTIRLSDVAPRRTWRRRILTLAAIIGPARATKGVISLDIARDLLDPESFIATAVHEDGAALERQESAPEVHRAMAMFPTALAKAPERTIFDASVDPVLV